MYYWFICNIYPHRIVPVTYKTDREPDQKEKYYGFAKAVNSMTRLSEQSIFVVIEEKIINDKDSIKQKFDFALSEFEHNTGLIKTLEYCGFTVDVVQYMVHGMLEQAKSLSDDDNLSFIFSIDTYGGIPTVNMREC